MNEIELRQMLEVSWRRPLTAEERTAVRRWLQDHPGRRDEVEAELRLTAVLHDLPDAEVPSNFTSQVWRRLEEQERGRPVASQGFRWREAGMRWMPRWALAGGVMAVAFALWWGQRVEQRRDLAAGLAASAAQFENLDPAMFGEFEAIRMMSEASAAVDDELLAALQ